jgi:hypothetical protein
MAYFLCILVCTSTAVYTNVNGWDLTMLGIDWCVQSCRSMMRFCKTSPITQRSYKACICTSHEMRCDPKALYLDNCIAFCFARIVSCGWGCTHDTHACAHTRTHRYARTYTHTDILTHTHVHSQGYTPRMHTHAHSYTHMHIHALTHTLSHSHTHTHTHSLSLSLSLTHTHTVTLTHSHTRSFTLTNSLSHTHGHSLSLTLSRTHTHTRTLAHSRSGHRHRLSHIPKNQMDNFWTTASLLAYYTPPEFCTPPQTGTHVHRAKFSPTNTHLDGDIYLPRPAI